MTTKSQPRIEGDQPDNSKDSIPACQSCRRKKAKCDREQPCAQCVRFDVPCIYDHNGRLKPGLRVGAVEQLQSRVDTLENMFIGQSLLWQQLWNSVRGGDSQPFNEPTTISKQSEHVKETLLQIASTDKNSEKYVQTHSEESRSKRRRLDTPTSITQSPTVSVVDELVEFYFANIHPWIPILHVRRFRHEPKDLDNPIIQAIMAVCLRFTSNPAAGDENNKRQMSRSYRQQVILNSMESFSVANLQALVIIAFDVIASGKGPSAWSIIGSMSRTVEQLQLSVEEPGPTNNNNKSGEFLIQRMAFLSPSSSWWEAEQRRRVFWTVFMMDRFCSVSTGWNPGLTRVDVQRRLPSEGALWEAEHEVQTPFFGIVDKSNLDNFGEQASSATQETERDAIGGFAYCIEATESLSLVTRFFLHHPLDLSAADKVRMWKMRFRELDLRLVQWKLHLPAKWRDASVLNDDGIMDPNLTLAHLTHNTAVILLHQSIAYPPSHWLDGYPGPLQSAVSAETCIDASTEIATIGHQFLQHSPILTSAPFSFCMFIAGRMLLTHARCRQVAVMDCLDTIIANLKEISRRWSGSEGDAEEKDLALTFANRLASARNNQQHNLDLRQAVYSDKTNVNNDTLPTTDGVAQSYSNLSPMTHDPFSLAFPPLPMAMQRPFMIEGLDAFDPSLPMARPGDQTQEYSFMGSNMDYMALNSDNRVSRYGTGGILESFNEPTASQSDTINGILR